MSILIDRNTRVFLSDATAALATTKATVALSVSFFAQVRLMTNFPGIFFSFVSSDCTQLQSVRDRIQKLLVFGS